MNGTADSARDRNPTEARLQALSADKARLLKLLYERKTSEARRIKSLERPANGSAAELPASWAQQRLWFIDRLEGGGAPYRIFVGLRLRGQLERHLLQHALDAIVRRHEVLRTVFVSPAGEPKQLVARDGRFPLTIRDLSHCAPAERETRLEQEKQAEAGSGFDLSTGPLIRGRLLKLSGREHVLLITLHHIICDGWSVGVLLRELMAVYSAGGENPLEPLPIQYADFAQWQRQWLTGEGLEKQLQYWQSRLQGAPPQLELPTDRPRPATHSYKGEDITFVLDARLTARVKAFAQQHEMTLFMVLFGGWALLLSRLSGENDVLIGTPVANRRRPELEGLIGLFVNTLVLRVGLQDDLPVKEYLTRVKDVTLGAYEHQDLPFEKLVEVLRPQRTLNRNPLFQVMFVLQNIPGGELGLPGVTVAAEESADSSTLFDLSLVLEEQSDQISASVRYATDLFDRSTLQRWMECYTVLLQGLVERPEASLRDLTLLSEPERHRLIQSFNATRTDFPQHKLIHELFEQHVQVNPVAPAVICRGKSLTYADLNRRSNQLARYLRTRGIGPDQPVGLCMERSLEMVVGVLGILKAGGAYVPLDPLYPVERLAFMVGDAAPRMVLSQKHLKNRLSLSRAEIIALEDVSEAIAQLPSNNLNPEELRSHHLAYVIYTSGSTGKPKGVMVEHRGVCNLATAQGQCFDIDASSQVLQFASINFDASVFEMVMALTFGATLHLAAPGEILAGWELERFVEERQITHLILPPTVLAGMPTEARLSSVHTLICGGEALRRSFVRRWAPGRSLFNAYGPTETTVWATLARCDATDEMEPTIGRPIANTHIYLLDASGEPVPVGVTGEIYIGGAGVARGYLNRPELTEDRFLSDPFFGDAQARMYRSGDLGRWRADGTIEYLGRNDSQVKIRGFRIELGEIEAQLVRHPQVKEAVVIAREDVPGDWSRGSGDVPSGEKRLVGYLVPRDETSVQLEELRDHLKMALPEHMVPAAFVVLESLPLTSNGKLDWRALPAPEQGAYVSRQYEAPQGKIEEILSGIWQELLRVPRVGRRDNFFELGGHSLLIVQLMERLRRVGLSGEIRRVFESQTLAELADVLSRGEVGESEVPPNRIPAGCDAITPAMLPLVELSQQEIDRIVQQVPGEAANIQDIYPLAPLQEGILFHHQLNEHQGDVYARPILLSVTAHRNLERLIDALQAVIDRHDILRTAVLWEQLPRPVQVVYRRAMLPVERIALASGQDALQQLQDRMSPEWSRLDLRRAPLMRLEIAPDPHSAQWYVLLRLHHIVADATSQQIIFSEVLAHIGGSAPTLSPPVPYRSHVAQALAHTATHDAETFFHSRLAEIDEPTAPFGLLDVHGSGSQILRSHEVLDPVLAWRIRRQASGHGVSVATLFHAAWALAVARTSGREDVVFGTVLLGRLQGSAGAQRVLGMFINTLPLRLCLKDLTAHALVEHTHRELIELLAHEQASLAVAQRCSGVSAGAPLFTALLNYRHSAVDFSSELADTAGVTVLASQGNTNYPIVLSVDDLGEGFALEMETDQRIDPHMLLGLMSTAIRAMVEALEQESRKQALELSILPDAEQVRLLQSFNATRLDISGRVLLHELFEEQVRRAPEAVAVIHEGSSITFRELNARANQLARYLRARGVDTDQLVGLIIDRSFDMVLGVLGILKAGGAYLPLDPTYPSERLAYMIRDAAPWLLLTRSTLTKQLQGVRTPLVELDGQWNEISKHDDTDLQLRITGLGSGKLAYVIYTSGSTGEPKGVMVEHRNVVNHWYALERLYRHPVDRRRVALNAPITFDASVQQWVQLLAGCTLFIVPQELRLDAQAMLGFLDENRIDGIDCTPSQLHGWIAAGLLEGDRPTSRTVLVGGEAIDAGLWRCLQQSREVVFYNVYGPTECTVDSTAADLREPSELAHIGRPLANTRIYILDRFRQLVPIGVVGEIYIGGAGVARGYLNRAELTAERFLKDPFSEDGEGRMYRSGDLGRWRTDGTIEYLGRNDQQVKVRGFRIELGEIEAQLARHPQVKEAVVIAREDATYALPSEKRLVAYVVLRDGGSPDVEGLRAHLKKVLPEHMVPAAFVVLESLPLTSNGKLDRRALPAPEQGAYVSRRYEAPQGEVEEILSGIWQELLGVSRVGRQDNFFELGGHSLIGLKLISQVSQRLGVRLPVIAIFKYPTLQQMGNLAEALRSIETVPVEDDKVELEGGVL
jgi:amino acid adenylation domain-containing protein